MVSADDVVEAMPCWTGAMEGGTGNHNLKHNKASQTELFGVMWHDTHVLASVSAWEVSKTSNKKMP